VLEYQLRTQEPLAPDEHPFAVTCACDEQLAEPIASTSLTDALDQVIARCDSPAPAGRKHGRSDPSPAAGESFLSRPDS
jgi:hypothetical protein